MKKFIVIFFTLFLALSNSFGQGKNDLYDLNRVHEIRLEFQRDNWAGVMDSLRLYGNGLLKGMAKVDGEEYVNIGVRYRGNRSFRIGNKRNALHIKLDHQDTLQNHQGYQTLKLSNALRDPSMVREVLGYEIAGKYMIAPRASYARVYINEEYYGLFVNVEAIDDVFLGKNFQSTENTLIKCTPDLNKKSPEGCKQNIFSSLEYEENMECYKSNYELKSAEGWSDLASLANALYKNNGELSKVLDVDATLWMLAFNNVLVNLSSYSGKYSQNFYLYKNNHGRFVPMLWDLNLAFGSFKNTGEGSDLSYKELIKLDPLLHVDNPYKPLISQLMKNPSYKKTYLSHMRTILYDNFMDNGYEQRAKELQKLIEQAFINDPNKTYTEEDFERSLYSMIGRRSKIPGIYSLMNKRAKFLKKHKSLGAIPPTIAEVNVLGREKYSNERVKDFKIQVKTANQARQVKVYYRFRSVADFQMVYLQDDGNSNDEAAGDDIFGGLIASDGNEFIEYYVVAENSLSVGYEPANYMFELRKASLKELNN
jgi:hypothetical protein